MKKHLFYLSFAWFAMFMLACSDNSSEPSPIVPDAPLVPIPEATVKNGSLDGKIIGSQWSVDYDNNNAKSERVNWLKS